MDSMCSGLTEEDFKKAIACGISKVNIFTDINVAQADAAAQALADCKGVMMDMIPYEVEAVAKACEEKMRLFGSCGRV